MNCCEQDQGRDCPECHAATVRLYLYLWHSLLSLKSWEWACIAFVIATLVWGWHV